MNNSDRKLIRLLWTVIAMLVIGLGLGGYLLVRHANELEEANSELTENNESLRRELVRAKNAAPSPSASPSPTATPTPSPSPSGSPSPTPTP